MHSIKHILSIKLVLNEIKLKMKTTLFSQLCCAQTSSNTGSCLCLIFYKIGSQYMLKKRMNHWIDPVCDAKPPDGLHQGILACDVRSLHSVSKSILWLFGGNLISILG